ncbi:N-carbamoyl-D-amino-acid hydrolase [Ketogulonicigenium vulgare]|uniref:Nitrilase/cyanide hydratase and apolipoprotein N-acyltransferase n=1 Tax=Ketogulonicigenium vulgare (strain WSH-001) TaxID=759362 RepID=F9YBI0_KETVW|nr:N-carbamoyl-D-amino-acid hydrolase [Ketogulonicigenium vulgare]AEM42732.1 Nitrilase/cyanide hydratase and apolipoprotein N-acyltransferase [Ketogulonicigenium vulgare WSH-001]ALJ82819.1 N-carbamoyl-D-amino acid hydrolase [Ketogulonicigenium vulgare]
MTRMIIGGAQMGGIQKAETREQVVQRMLALMDQAHAAGVSYLAYPEMTLTTFFPRYYAESRADFDHWFETEMPNPQVQPLFDRARAYGMGFSFGFCELTPEGQHFNTAIVVSPTGDIVLTYRKTHLPGHAEFEPERTHQHLEKRYFLPGDTGFNVAQSQGVQMGLAICNDRRWPESWRVLGLQGVELVSIGYNTPSQNNLSRDEGPEKRLYHHELSVCAGAYQNATYAIAVAKCGLEDGYHMIGGSMIVDPDGFVIARATGEGDELITAEADFDKCAFGRSTVFNFAQHRRIEHYTRIATQTGVEVPQ